MADPVVRKVTELTEIDVVEAADTVLINDVSENDPSKKTKRSRADKLKIFGSSQLADSVVTAAKLGTGAALGNLADESIPTGKIADNAITEAKLATNAVETAKIKDLNVTTAKLADNAVTEAKLGTIKRTVTLRVTSPEDEVEIADYGRFFFWPVTLHNFVVSDARINLAVASSSGNVTVALTNASGLMSTLSLPSGATGMGSSGSINPSYRTATTNYSLFVNVTAKGTGAKGLSITLVLEGIPS